MWSFLLCCSILSSIYISEFVVVWFPPPIISQFYISLLPTRYDGMHAMSVPKLYKQSYSYGVYIGVYCCSLSFWHFILVISFPRIVISIHPPDWFVPIPLQCHVYCYIILLATFWLIVVYNINCWSREIYYMHQHFTLYITRFEHSATRVRWPRTPSFCHGIIKSQQ